MKSYSFCVALLAAATVLTAGETVPATPTTNTSSNLSSNAPQIPLMRIPDVVDPLGSPAATTPTPAATEPTDRDTLPLPAVRVESNLPAPTLDSAATQEVEEAAPKPKSSKLWVTSMFAFAGGTTLDGVSSWGRKEANPLLTSANGNFELKGVLIKAGLAGMVLVPQLIHKPKDDTTRKIMTVVNFADAAVYSAVGIHNYAMH